MKIFTAYFSATNTTKTIVKEIADALGGDVTNYNLTNKQVCDGNREVLIAPEDVLLVGMPVYAGRIPAVVVDALKCFKGSHTPAILVAVYGNREIDDALVEMQDLVESNGFFVAAAASFIAQHSIFPRTAKGRPDASDHLKIKNFGKLCKEKLQNGFSIEEKSVDLPGNRPYKTPGDIPLKVVTDANCVECQACVSVCPVDAIPAENPHVTDYDKCIHCGRCIHTCSVHARHYGGLLYHVAGAVFSWKNRKRKEPQFFF